MVGLKSLLLTCRSNITLSRPSYTGSALKRELNFCNGYLSLLYFCILAWKCNLIKKWLQLMILKLLSECCTLMQFIAVGARGLGAVPPPFLNRSVDPVTTGGWGEGCLCPPPSVFLDLRTARQVHTGSMVPTNILYSRFTCTLLTYVHIPSSYRVIFENYYFSTSKVSHISSSI